MDRLGARLAAVRSEAGFTLIELLVAMSMFAVVLTAVMTMFDVASNEAYNEQERNISVFEASSGVDRMARELREAYQVIGPTTGTSSNYFDFLTRVVSGGAEVDKRIIYDCTQSDPTTTGLKECVRYIGSATAPATPGVPPTGASSSVVVGRVLNNSASDPNDPVFTNLSNVSGSGSAARPTFGQIVVKIPGKGTRKQSSYTYQNVLSDSFYIRQLDFGR